MLKQKMLDVVWVTGLGFCVLFTLLQFELQVFHSTVDMLTNFFYIDQAHADLTVEHKDAGVEGMIKQVFGKDAKVAIAITKAENNSHQCDRVSKQNKNGSFDIGVFQISYPTHSNKASLKQLMDCKKNIEVAYQIFKQQGNWNAWTTFRNGSYKRFLN